MKSKTAREDSKKRLQLNPNSKLTRRRTIMIIKTALVAALTLGTVSVALADVEFDANLQNRYPQASTAQTFQSSNVALTDGRTAVIRSGAYAGQSAQVWSNGGR